MLKMESEHVLFQIRTGDPSSRAALDRRATGIGNSDTWIGQILSFIIIIII
jgi:hypothetical protein